MPTPPRRRRGDSRPPSTDRLDHGSPSSCRTHLGRRRLGLGARPVVHERDVGAGPGEIDRHCGADALSAGDENAAPARIHDALVIDRAFDDDAEGERACRRRDADDDDLVAQVVGRRRQGPSRAAWRVDADRGGVRAARRLPGQGDGAVVTHRSRAPDRRRPAPAAGTRGWVKYPCGRRSAAGARSGACRRPAGRCSRECRTSRHPAAARRPVSRPARRPMRARPSRLRAEASDFTHQNSSLVVPVVTVTTSVASACATAGASSGGMETAAVVTVMDWGSRREAQQSAEHATHNHDGTKARRHEERLRVTDTSSVDDLRALRVASCLRDCRELSSTFARSASKLNAPKNADFRLGALHRVSRARPLNSCARVVPSAGLSTTLNGVNHFMAPQAGPCSTLFFTVSCDWPAATAMVSAVSSKLIGNRRHLHDLGDEATRELLRQSRQRPLLRVGSALVDVHHGAHERRRFAADLADAEIAVARDRRQRHAGRRVPGRRRRRCRCARPSRPAGRSSPLRCS